MAAVAPAEICMRRQIAPTFVVAKNAAFDTDHLMEFAIRQLLAFVDAPFSRRLRGRLLAGQCWRVCQRSVVERNESFAKRVERCLGAAG